jgi:hypothetical protein
VLELSQEQVEKELQELCELKDNWGDRASTFYSDGPLIFLRSLVPDDLRRRVENSSLNPSSVFRRLADAIKGDTYKMDLGLAEFDWVQARNRYQSELSKLYNECN